MRNFAFLAFIALVLSGTVNAQNNRFAPDHYTAKSEPGRLMIQFGQAIKLEAFADTWLLKQKAYYSGIEGMTTMSAAGLAHSALTLSQNLRPGSFKDDFNRAIFTRDATRAKTYSEAYAVLKSLEEGLKGSSYAPLWSNKRSKWLHELSLLK